MLGSRKTLAVVMIGLSPYFAHADRLCDFMPENDLRIPVHAPFANRDMNQSAFNEILSRIERVYGPIVAAKGGRLQVIKDWDNDQVNAYANRSGDTWQIHMFGGMARHPQITNDGFALIACHELGHHLGGAPRYNGRWASNEGQSDYWATLKCAHKIWGRDNNGSLMNRVRVPASVRRGCAESFPNSEASALCARSAMAAYALGAVLASMTGGGRPDFDTPDTSRVNRTDDGHPEAQCRLDTYYAGALCKANPNVDVSASDPDHGTCSQGRGARPQCWYRPGANGAGNDLCDDYDDCGEW